MIDKKLAKKIGMTNNRLCEIFTAEEGTEDCKIAKPIVDRIRARIDAGMKFCLSRADYHLASDKAWDTPTVSGEYLPLDLMAQGHISAEAATAALGEKAKKYLVEDEKAKGTYRFDLPKFYNFAINMAKAYVQRRHRTLKVDYSNTYPFFDYAPVPGAALKDKLNADILTELVERMTDSFGYRLHSEDAYRAMLMYPDVWSFVSSQWSKKRRVVLDDTDSQKVEVVAEGVEFAMPHPSRVYYDTSKSPGYMNFESATTPQYIGYWDIVPYRDISSNVACWNKDAIAKSTTLSAAAAGHLPFFEFYFNKSLLSGLVQNHYDWNDRTRNNSNHYTAEDGDKGIYYARHFELITPSTELGIPYDEPVWIEFWVASDSTIVWADFLPCAPAAYLGSDNAPNRINNTSFMHELLPFQDQVTAEMTAMMKDVKTAATRVWWINTDVLTDEMRKYLESSLQGNAHVNDTLIAFYSLAQKEADGLTRNGKSVDIENLMTLARAEMGNAILQHVQVINSIMDQADRILMVSQQERGMASPRRTSASEVSIIDGHVSTIVASYKEAIDKYREGLKRIIYECWASEKYHVKEPIDIAVANQYDESVIKEAGFEVSVSKPSHGSMVVNVNTVKPIVSSRYRFSSRDGDVRQLNEQGAQVLVQLLQVIGADQDFSMRVGANRKMQILSEISRLLGGHVPMKFTEAELEGGTQREIDQVKAVVAELGQAVQALMGSQGGGEGGGQAQPQGQMTMQPQMSPQQAPDATDLKNVDPMDLI